MMKRKIISWLLLLALALSGYALAEETEIPAADYAAENMYMQLAIDQAREGIYHQHGGPFGSVIVKDGEITAIRDAEQNLGTYDLTGCVLYTTGEPCPMCLAACMWANIDTVYYGCTIADNALIGFRDEAFDNMFGGREAFADYLVETDRDACLKLFAEYSALDATIY